MTNQNPEQVARDHFDRMLLDAGWHIQNFKELNLSAGQGIAVREVTLKLGCYDYLLLVDRQPVGVIEAKNEGTTLSTVAEQSGRYGEDLPDFFDVDGPLPFYYESTGVETFFRDERDPEPRSRQPFSFHRPETLADGLKKPDTLRGRLKEMAARASAPRGTKTNRRRSGAVVECDRGNGSVGRSQPQTRRPPPPIHLEKSFEGKLV